MSIKVCYFASLKEGLGRDGDVVDYVLGLTPREIWDGLNKGRPLPANVLVAVNMDYAGLDSVLEDGDELAFFPPVTGGAL